MRTRSMFNMTVTMGAVVLATLLGALFPASQALAADFLTGSEVKKLVTDSTIQFEVAGKGKFKAYLDSSGKVTRVHNGQVAEGDWRVKDNGELCVRYGDKEERCGTVKKNGDGTYTRVDDAKVTNHWTKVSKGKNL